jgi:putative ABC transport system substrate-binding protein
MPVVGFLNPTRSALYTVYAASFRQGLQAQGFVEGKNVHIEYRWGEGDYTRLPAMAAELAALRVAVIAATGDVASPRAAQAASATIPVVFTIGADPVKYGLVASYNRPGGRITGISAITGQVGSKRVDMLHQLVSFTKLAVMGNPENPPNRTEQLEAEEAARRFGREAILLNIRTKAELEAALDAFVREDADAIYIASDPLLLSERGCIAEFAASHRVPAIHFDRQFPEAGGLISYGTSIADMYRLAGTYCGQISKGANPAEMPVLQPTKFELVVNVKTARELGINVPDTLLAIADEVIE